MLITAYPTDLTMSFWASGFEKAAPMQQCSLDLLGPIQQRQLSSINSCEPSWVKQEIDCSSERHLEPELRGLARIWDSVMDFVMFWLQTPCFLYFPITFHCRAQCYFISQESVYCFPLFEVSFFVSFQLRNYPFPHRHIFSCAQFDLFVVQFCLNPLSSISTH